MKIVACGGMSHQRRCEVVRVTCASLKMRGYPVSRRYPATGDLDFSLKGHFEFEGAHGA